MRDTGPFVNAMYLGTHPADGQSLTPASWTVMIKDHTIKDNRLLPRGWTAKGPDPSLSGEFLQATFPEGEALKDPSYANGSGNATGCSPSSR